jgi:hypothetical protein
MNVITDTTSLPEQFESVEEAADFWDTHSLADYWDQVHEVEIEVRAPSAAGDAGSGCVGEGGQPGAYPRRLARDTFPKAAPACPRAFGCFLAALLTFLDRLRSFREGASPRRL